MRRCLLALIMCSLVVGLASPALAAASFLTTLDSLSGPILKLIEEESLTPLQFDREGNLILSSAAGHKVLMTEAFLAEYDGQHEDCDELLLDGCPCTALGKIWDLIKEIYVIYCLCREFVSRCGDVDDGWGECRSPGYYFITCDIINGVVYWR